MEKELFCQIEMKRKEKLTDHASLEAVAGVVNEIILAKAECCRRSTHIVSWLMNPTHHANGRCTLKSDDLLQKYAFKIALIFASICFLPLRRT
ncbi:hypothetical protein T11_8394 [Trichinella zimbabwensis]|uniref:Uncharacterized protein n=1 Tax=Trichinella zimbabwensis TaxID=268475 RepID=A0A0V1HVI3_9BILA|nr:hypothetical protein T11_8394 [Trichinella zimbabwensis]